MELETKAGNCPKRLKTCMIDAEQTYARGEAGRARARAPKAETRNKIGCSLPCLAKRVGAFAGAFIACGRSWLIEPAQEVGAKLPPELLKANERYSMKRYFSDNLRVRRLATWGAAGKRHDPARYDGGASLLHGGPAVFGRRRLEL